MRSSIVPIRSRPHTPPESNSWGGDLGDDIVPTRDVVSFLFSMYDMGWPMMPEPIPDPPPWAKPKYGHGKNGGFRGNTKAVRSPTMTTGRSGFEVSKRRAYK